ncbi:MAG TPA: PQQ-binding-like beta-propeller repeat protein [Acidimicrobiales bacterium]|nr:PQQ-binding-like beta-propeller repeat protein [Acidimicrobiales bacterium]
MPVDQLIWVPSSCEMTTDSRRRVPPLLVATTVALSSCSSTHHRASPPAPATSPTSAASASQATTAPTNPGIEGSWTTYDGDASRTARDLTSPPLGAPRVAWTSPTLDGPVYAQPLVVGSSVIVATENDTVYSLNPATGAVNWSRHLGSPVRASALPCGNIDPSGITGTPVADPAARTLWVVTFTTPTAHTLWQVNLDNGQVRGSRPADPPGADPRTEQQRGALTLSAGRIYIPYGGLYGDCSDYHGWLVALKANPSDGGARATYETPAERAGIWAPPGPVIDSAGDVLVATGNGLLANVPGDANSVVRLDPSLRVVARFTAPDYQHLSETDGDLGSVSPTIVAGGNVLQVGKEAVGYLLPANLSSPLQTFHACNGAFGGTAVDGDNVYLSCYDGLYALGIPTSGKATVRWAVTGIRPGPPIIAGGTVWTVDRGGALRGYSENDGTKRYSDPVAVAGSFPTLSASGGSLFVTDGTRIIAFSGV